MFIELLLGVLPYIVITGFISWLIIGSYWWGYHDGVIDADEEHNA